MWIVFSLISTQSTPNLVNSLVELRYTILLKMGKISPKPWLPLTAITHHSHSPTHRGRHKCQKTRTAKPGRQNQPMPVHSALVACINRNLKWNLLMNVGMVWTLFNSRHENVLMLPEKYEPKQPDCGALINSKRKCTSQCLLQECLLDSKVLDVFSAYSSNVNNSNMTINTKFSI